MLVLWVLCNHTAPYIRQKQGFHTVFRPQNHTHHTQTARPVVRFSAQRDEKRSTPTQRKTKKRLSTDRHVPSFNHTYLIILQNFAYNNGECRIADLRTSLNGEVFAPLKDLEYFKRFTIKFNTIEWENGADFAPEYLYDISTTA